MDIYALVNAFLEYDEWEFLYIIDIKPYVDGDGEHGYKVELETPKCISIVSITTEVLLGFMWKKIVEV